MPLLCVDVCNAQKFQQLSTEVTKAKIHAETWVTWDTTAEFLTRRRGPVGSGFGGRIQEVWGHGLDRSIHIELMISVLATRRHHGRTREDDCFSSG